MAIIAQFKFCMGTGKHAGDRDPLAEILPSCEILESNSAACQRLRGIPRGLTRDML